MSLRVPGAGEDGGAPSFMNDQGQGHGSGDGGGALGVSLGESLPLDGGKFASKHSGILVLVMVMAVASVALWGMRQIGMGANRSVASDITLDIPLDGNGASDLPDHDVIISQLRDGAVSQIPAEDVEKNPFNWDGIIDDTPTTTGPTNTVDPAEQARRERRQRIQSELSTFRLISVMGGSIPVARISGELVREGDPLGEFFTVEDIATRRVILIADGNAYTLTMDEN